MNRDNNPINSLNQTRAMLEKIQKSMEKTFRRLESGAQSLSEEEKKVIGPHIHRLKRAAAAKTPDKIFECIDQLTKAANDHSGNKS